MERRRVKEVGAMLCIGVALMGIGVMKSDRGKEWGKKEEVSVTSGVRMWEKDSPNTFAQVIAEVTRLNALFQQSVALQDQFFESYIEEGNIPEDYREQIEGIIVASPYSEVEDFVTIHNEYKKVQKQYFDYVTEHTTWDKTYLNKEEKKMTNLIKQYLAEVDLVIEKTKQEK